MPHAETNRYTPLEGVKFFRGYPSHPFLSFRTTRMDDGRDLVAVHQDRARFPFRGDYCVTDDWGNLVIV